MKEEETIIKYSCDFCRGEIEEKHPFTFKEKHICFSCLEKLRKQLKEDE